MAILNSKFDILRGWPQGSAVCEELTAAAPADAAKDTLTEGTWVRLKADATTPYTALDENRVGKTCEGSGANVESLWGLVIEGRGDNSAVESGKVSVLLGGGYVVRLWNDPDALAAAQMFTKLNLIPGDPVTLIDGLIKEAAAPGAAEAATVMGHVLAVVTDADNGDTLDVYISL